MYRIRIPYSELLIKAAFFLFFFFTFFPTSEPFPPLRQEIGVENMSETNPVNQLIKITVFTLTLLASIYKFDGIIDFIKREKFLAIFLLWAFLSMFWSDFPFVTFKRWFQILVIYFLLITYFSYFSVEDSLKLIKGIIYPYIIITIVSCLFIPGAIDPQFGTWRGLTPQKNSLGQLGVLLSGLTLVIINAEKMLIKKIVASLFFLMSIIITLATFSSTSYITLFIFLIGSSIYWVKTKVFGKLGVQNSIFIYTFIVGILTLIVVIIFVPQFTDLIQGIFGKSETFYDRGKLWTAMLWHITQHPIIGCGYQAFWTIENPQLSLLYKNFVWLPNQAHNGYLDLLNELGIIGLIFFLIMILKNVWRSVKNQILSPWLWFLILPLIHNLTESNFFLMGSPTFTLIIYSYLIIEKSNTIFK